MTLDERFEEAKAYYDNEVYDTAVPLLQALANEGHGEAQVYLSEAYSHGNGVAKDPAKAAEWQHKAGYSWLEHRYQEAKAMFDDGCGGYDATPLLQALADEGHAKARYYLGCAYQIGDYGVESDEDKANELYRTALEGIRAAAERGDAEAQYILSKYYWDADVIEQDEALCAEWTRKSAEQGYVLGQFHYGWCFECGVGVPEDYTKAAEWYSKAAAQGDEDAQNKITQFKAEGKI